MAWRDLRNSRPAQLGNARFLVLSGSAEFGRKTAVHEYPLRDKPFVEDLGRDTRQFSIEAYVIGADYMAARDALIAEIERAGPHRLVHPYFGEMRVDIIGKAHIEESTREGGMARISIPCIEAGELVFPSAAIATQDVVASQADAAVVAIQDDFAESFDVSGTPDFVSDSAESLVGDLTETMDDITRTITTLPDALPEFLATLNDVSVSVSSLILAPATLAGKITDAIAQFNVIAQRPEASLDILRDLFGFGADAQAVPTTTANRQAQARNQAAFFALVQRAAVVEAVRASATVAFTSYDDAVALRSELIEAVDALADVASDDAVYYALTKIKTAMINDITARGADLARVVQRQLRAPIPAIVLAYDLYGDLDLEADILARNSVRDPLFMPSAEPVEVLSNG